MEIQITNNKRIKEIQDEFNNKFPFLKVEFYYTGHEEHEGSPKEDTIPNDKKIGEVRSAKNSNDFNIHGNMNVATLESEFKEVYNLNVQVFRKSGNIWLQTTSTDNWSLSEQNKMGEEMSEN